MKKLTLFGILIFWAFVSNAQNFDIIDFNKKAHLAEWLYEYDMIAWWTSDSVLTGDKSKIAQLGKVWFCYEDDKNIWHAFYGKDKNGIFHSVFQYEVDTNYKIKKSTTFPDTSILNSFSRAITQSLEKIKKIKDSDKLRFNQFVRKNAQNEIEVWILPAFQPNSFAVYGGEFHYTFNSTGTKLILEDQYFQGEFRAFKVGEPREIWLNYTDVEKPTLGAIFFVWYYKKYFTKINVETSKSISTLVKADGSYSWIHVEKDLVKKMKKKKKK